MRTYHYKFRKLHFWPEQGMICIEDERFPAGHPRSFQIVPRIEFLQRLNAISEELKLHRFKYADEREEYIRFMEQGVEACRKAKQQGDPLDPKAMEDMLKQRRNHYVLGNGQPSTKGGQGTIGHATPAAFAPENLLLPPIPDHPEKVAKRKKVSR